MTFHMCDVIVQDSLFTINYSDMWLLVLSDGLALFAAKKSHVNSMQIKKNTCIFSIVKVKACLTFMKLL